jgi:hypothetical protein
VNSPSVSVLQQKEDPFPQLLVWTTGGGGVGFTGFTGFPGFCGAAMTPVARRAVMAKILEKCIASEGRMEAVMASGCVMWIAGFSIYLLCVSESDAERREERESKRLYIRSCLPCLGGLHHGSAEADQAHLRSFENSLGRERPSRLRRAIRATMGLSRRTRKAPKVK